MTRADYVSRAYELIKRRDLQQAEHIAKHFIDLYPKDDLAYFTRAIIAYEANRNDEAIRLIEKAISINPAQQNYYSYLGICLESAGRKDEAIIAHRHATSLDPHYSKRLIDLELLPYISLDQTVKSNMEHPKRFCSFSYPKSGTHLLCDILQKVTGHSFYWPEYTGLSLDTFYDVPEKSFLINHSFPNLECFDYMKKEGYKIIVNYRDPRDQLVSYYKYYIEKLNDGDNEYGKLLRRFTKEQAITILTTTSLAGGLANPARLALWLNAYLVLAREGIPVLFITYEEMVQRKSETIKRIVNFLGFELSNAKVDMIIEETSFKKSSVTLKKKGQVENSLKRKGEVGDWQNHFTPLNKETYNSVAGKFLAQLGYQVC